MLPIIKGTLSTAVGETTAVDEDHDGFFSFTAGRYPNIQSKAVFIEGVGKLK